MAKDPNRIGTPILRDHGASYEHERIIPCEGIQRLGAIEGNCLLVSKSRKFRAGIDPQHGDRPMAAAENGLRGGNRRGIVRLC